MGVTPEFEKWSGRLDSKPPSLELRRAKPATLRPRSRCATICDRVVRGREEHARSDIDLLVEFDPANTPSLFGVAAMEIELSELLGGRKIDLRTPQDLSRYFRDEVVRTAEIQYAS